MHGLGHGWLAGPPWSLMDAASHSPHAASSHWLWSAADLGTSSISPRCQRWAVRCWRPASGLSAWWQGWCRPQRQKSSHRVPSTSAALCHISRHCSVGAAALPKPRRDMSDFRREEQLVIKNNNLEVLELYFPWLPHAQNLNPTDKSCTFGFNILMLFYSRAGWSPQPGFVGGTKDLPDTWLSAAHSSLPGTVIYNSQRKLWMTLLPTNCFKVNLN